MDGTRDEPDQIGQRFDQARFREDWKSVDSRVEELTRTVAHMERDRLPLIRDPLEVVSTLDRDQIVVRSTVGGFVKSFDPKAA